MATSREFHRQAPNNVTYKYTRPLYAAKVPCHCWPKRAGGASADLPNPPVFDQGATSVDTKTMLRGLSTVPAGRSLQCKVASARTRVRRRGAGRDVQASRPPHGRVVGQAASWWGTGTPQAALGAEGHGASWSWGPGQG